MKCWFPLEANPSVLNHFASKLGLDTSKVAFCDVFSLDEVRTTLSRFCGGKGNRSYTVRRGQHTADALVYVQGDLKTLLPQPVYAFLLLYPDMPKGYTGDVNCALMSPDFTVEFACSQS